MLLREFLFKTTLVTYDEAWEDGCKEQEGDTSFTQSSFTIPVNNRFSSLGDEYIPSDPD